MVATIKRVVCLVLCSVLVSSLTIQEQNRADEEPSCTQIDFDDETLTSLRKCGYIQEFTAKPYDESTKFDPYRPGANYYLSNEWQGKTCGEAVRTYSFNTDTELRMAYNAVFESGATLEVRVYDLDRLDSTGNAILVESWRTASSTDGWGFFREKLNKTVIRAQIQIEANMNAGSDLAIEYLTIFNYEVDTEECSAIDEFLTTTEIPTTTTEGSTTAFPVTTTTTATTTATTLATTTPTTSTTMLSTETEEITIPTTEVSEDLPTTTSEATTSTSETTPTTTTTTLTTTTTSIPTTTTTIASTTTTSTTATPITTTTTVITTEFTTTTSSTPTATAPSTTTSTTTNAPRDDTSMLPTSSTTVQQSTTMVDSVATSISQTPPGPISPPDVDLVGPNQWMWMTLAAMFGTLLLLATSAVLYLWYANQHLDRVMMRLLDELCYEKYNEKPLKTI